MPLEALDDFGAGLGALDVAFVLLVVAVVAAAAAVAAFVPSAFVFAVVRWPQEMDQVGGIRVRFDFHPKCIDNRSDHVPRHLIHHRANLQGAVRMALRLRPFRWNLPRLAQSGPWVLFSSLANT